MCHFYLGGLRGLLLARRSRIPAEGALKITQSVTRTIFSSMTSLTAEPVAVQAAVAEAEEVIVEDNGALGGVRIAVLNRPRVLNSLNLNMINQLTELYKKWDHDRRVNCIILKGAGRAFCAGGDVKQVYQLGLDGDVTAARDFFTHEYHLNHLISTLRKPHISLINGVIMGGGNGLAMHGKFRVVTENAVFAMPETAIGLHPDVGASYFLSRLHGHFGEYLGLTGARLDAADMLELGLATHAVPAERLAVLQDRIAAVDSSEERVIHSAILNFSEQPSIRETSPLLHQETIDECFSKSSVEEILATLEEKNASGDHWCSTAIAALKKLSPTSLKVSLRSIREGRKQTLAGCLQREHRLSYRCLGGPTSHDYYEGVRAVLVEKDNNPKWDPSDLEKVTPKMVDSFFSALPSDEEELHFQANRAERSRL